MKYNIFHALSISYILNVQWFSFVFYALFADLISYIVNSSAFESIYLILRVSFYTFLTKHFILFNRFYAFDSTKLFCRILFYTFPSMNFSFRFQYISFSAFCFVHSSICICWVKLPQRIFLSISLITFLFLRFMRIILI